MFHRPNPKTETDNAAQPSFLKEPQTPPAGITVPSPEKTQNAVSKPSPAKLAPTPAEIFAKTEKEKEMFQNQPTPPATDSSEGETPAPNRPIDIPGAAALQRPMQPGSRMPGAFPGSYSTTPAAGVTPTPAKSTDGRRLVVGEGISLSGEIEACDVLIVEGTIEAALKGAKILDIAETGVFYGTVQIEDATIAGRFEGDLTVNGRLTVRSTGSITGSVSYKELAVEAGAILDGKVVPLSGSRADKKSDRPAKKQANRNDNAGNELPFAAGAVVAQG